MYDETRPYYDQMGYGNEVLERFWKKVDKSDDLNTCMEWTANKNKGYGQFWFNGVGVVATRFIYECFNGPIPKGLLIRHTCDNPSCVNPHHLIQGTQKDNINDMISRDRQNYSEGSEHYLAVLNEKDIVNILSNIHNGVRMTMIDISRSYDVDMTTVCDILNGVSWKPITNLFCKNNKIKLSDLKKTVLSFRNSENNSKLKEKDITDILDNIQNNKYKSITEIAKCYSVTMQNIFSILNGDTWKYITNKYCKENGYNLKDLKNKAKNHHSTAKLTENNVGLIKRRLGSKEKISLIAKDFGVTRRTIYDIKNNISWIHIK